MNDQREIVYPWSDFYKEPKISFEKDKLIVICLGTPDEFSFNFPQSQIIYVSDKLEKSVTNYVCDNPEHVFILKSTVAAHPLCVNLWNYDESVIYVGSTKRFESIYELMLIVKSYSKFSKYALFGEKDWVVPPSLPKTPFNLGELMTREEDILFYQCLCAELNYYVSATCEVIGDHIQTKKELIYIGGNHLYNVANNIIILLVCNDNIYVNYIGHFQYQFANLNVLSTIIKFRLHERI